MANCPTLAFVGPAPRTEKCRKRIEMDVVLRPNVSFWMPFRSRNDVPAPLWPNERAAAFSHEIVFAAKAVLIGGWGARGEGGWAAFVRNGEAVVQNHVGVTPRSWKCSSMAGFGHPADSVPAMISVTVRRVPK